MRLIIHAFLHRFLRPGSGWWIVLFGLAVTGARGQGGPPMITDDPGTVEKGHWEINTAITIERRPGENVTEMPLVDLNYGLTDRLHLKYEASWLRLSDASGVHQGMSNSLIGAKWRFYDEGEKGWQVSTYPQLELNNPGSRADERGLATHGTSVLLPVQVMKDFGAVSLNGDFGLVTHPGGNAWFGGLVAGRAVTKGFELLAELHAEADANLHETSLVVNFGTRVTLSEHFTLLASAGRELQNRVDARATLVVYVGLQTHF